MSISSGTAARIIRIGLDVIEGQAPSPADVARAIVGIGLDLVPVEELRSYLTEEARRRGELAADAAEAIKFPNG